MTRQATFDPIRVEDLLTSPGQRMAVGVCADVSYSMAGAPIVDLNRALALFFASLKSEALTRAGVEVAVVAFATQAATVLDFQSLKRVAQPPELAVDGALGWSTALGRGVSRTLDLVERRKAEYGVVGVDYFQPLLVILSDACANEGDHTAVAARVRELEAARKLVVLPIAVGQEVDLELLSHFSARNPPLHLADRAFDQFFGWLTEVVREVSKSCPGAGVRYKRYDRKGWVDLA